MAGTRISNPFRVVDRFRLLRLVATKRARFAGCHVRIRQPAGSDFVGKLASAGNAQRPHSLSRPDHYRIRDLNQHIQTGQNHSSGRGNGPSRSRLIRTIRLVSLSPSYGRKNIDRARRWADRNSSRDAGSIPGFPVPETNRSSAPRGSADKK